jgi:hypothetical protein
MTYLLDGVGELKDSGKETPAAGLEHPALDVA